MKNRKGLARIAYRQAAKRNKPIKAEPVFLGTFDNPVVST